MTGRDSDRDDRSSFLFLASEQIATLAATHENALVGASYSEQLLRIREGLTRVAGTRRSLMSFVNDEDQPHLGPEHPPWLVEVSSHNEWAARSITRSWIAARKQLADYDDRVEFRVTGWIDGGWASPSIEPEEANENFYRLLGARHAADLFTRDLDWEHGRIWEVTRSVVADALDWEAIQADLDR